MPLKGFVYLAVRPVPDEARCCVILYSEDLEKNPYISIIMGAEDKSFLYQEMNRLLEAGETTKTE